jgi:hypothetical protein
MESNQRYYERRAAEELRAATRALTPEAHNRRRALAELFAAKAAECGGRAAGFADHLAVGALAMDSAAC